MSICATVILYNPAIEAYENILSYANRVDELIIVDNSTKYNNQLINKLLSNVTKVKYINNSANLGIASALNIACRYAIENDYQWILTMDQDSRFINFDHYTKCLDQHKESLNIALLAANTMWHAEEHLPNTPSKEYEEKFLVITSGNFLNLKLFDTIGGFEDKLFIDMVDHDYCIRAQIHNFKILYFKDVLVEHSLGMLFQRKNLITRKIRNKIEHNAQRVYYISRNTFYTWQQYRKYFPNEFNLLKTINIIFIHEITKIFLYEDNKIDKIKAKFIGLYHFLRGKYGKYDI